jgi:hypothetical protein
MATFIRSLIGASLRARLAAPLHCSWQDASANGNIIGQMIVCCVGGEALAQDKWRNQLGYSKNHSSKVVFLRLI